MKTRTAPNAWKLIGRGTMLLMSENMRRLSGVPAHLASDKAIRSYFKSVGR